MSKDPDDAPAISKKNLKWAVTTIIGFFGVIATVHAAVVMPAITSDVTEAVMKHVDQRIAEHEQHPHEGAVTRREWDLLLSRLNDFSNDIKGLATKDHVESLRREMMALHGRQED